METLIFEQNCYASNNNDIMNDFANAGRNLAKQYVSRFMKTESANFGGTRVKDYFKTIEYDNYEADNKSFIESIIAYSVKACGGDYKYESIADLKNRQLNSDPRFISRFDAVLAQVINPVVADIASEAFFGLADTVLVGNGETARFTVDSNETFYVSEIAEGVQTGGLQRLYNNEVTVNPTPKQIRVDLPFYQIAAGLFDMGAWLYKIGISYTGYISAKVISGVTTALAEIPAAYKVQGAFTDTNFVTVAQRVKAANGGKMVQAWGTMAALSRVLPAATGLQYGLGEEISKIGYLNMYKGIPLIEMEQTMTPGTVNTTATLMLPDNKIYFVPVGGYKPVKIAFEGDSVTVEKDPNRSSDKVMGFTVTMRVGIKAVIGSIFGSYEING